MSEVSVLQQLYINQTQSILGNPSKQMTHKQTTYRMQFILSMLTGILICGVPLAAVLTLYIKQQSCTRESTTTVSTITTISVTTRMNQTNSSMSIKQAYYCKGVSSYTLWQLFSNNGIFMNIDTSSCNYNSTPLYFTSIAGITYHWVLGGYGAIYVPTRNSFIVYARSLVDWNNTFMLSRSQVYEWNVDWFGISN